MQLAKRVFPFLGWFSRYGGREARADLLAGLTVALVLIPQSMAYAQLAGLPPFYGLYAAFIPPMTAALFGSSRHLATGPVAVVSLMTAASLGPLAAPGTQGYIAYAVLLCFTVGVFQLLLGVFRLGVLVNFLSHPVVNGFTNAAAIIIATSQLSKLFGVDVDEASHHYETIARVVEAALHYTHGPTLAIGVLAFVIMYVLKRLNPRIPYVLVAVLVTTVLTWALGLADGRTVPLSAIHTRGVGEALSGFNTAVAEANALALNRTKVTAMLREAANQKESEPLGRLTLAQEADRATYLIERLRGEAAQYRGQLREYLFSGVTGPDGSLALYERGREPPGEATDGRTWRLKVGNRALKEDALSVVSGVAVVGSIPEGLPGLHIPPLRMADILTLLPYAVIISFLGFMEAISIAKAMAARTGQILDPNQELIGQGLANMLGSFTQSYPTSGSFSRSAVNLQAGAASGLSSVFTSLAVVVTLLFLTPFLYYLPQATLAAVIMMAVVGLVNIPSFVHAWHTHRVDGAILLISFLCTLAFAPHLDRGIMVGVALSIGVFIYNSMRPQVAYLSLHPDCSYRDATHWGMKTCRHIAMIRFDAPLFFANASYFEDLVRQRIAALPELRHILLVANGVNDMDASGEEVLALTVDNVRAAGIRFSVSGVKENVLALMKRTHLYEKIGEDDIFATQVIAIRAIFEEAHRGSSETLCPLTSICFIEPTCPVEPRGEEERA